MSFDAWHCIKHITMQYTAAGAPQGILGCVFCVSQHLQSGKKKPQGNVLVLPDKIYYYVRKTAVEHLSDNDTIVNMKTSEIQ